MVRIQNRHVDWERHQIAIPGAHANDAENLRIPFNPLGRLAPILKRPAALGPNAFVFGSEAGEYIASFKTAWESILLLATATTPNGQSAAPEWTAKSSNRSTCTGTTCVMKLPAACWRTLSISDDSTDARARGH